MAKLFEGKLSSIKKVVYKKGSSTSEPNVVDFDKKAKWVRSYTLSWDWQDYFPQGGLSIKRVSSLVSGVSLDVELAIDGSGGQVLAYFGDKFTISVKSIEDYEITVVQGNSLTISGNIKLSFSKRYLWKTFISSSTTYSASSTPYSLSGLVAGRKTRASFRGNIDSGGSVDLECGDYGNYGPCSINERDRAISNNGIYSSSGNHHVVGALSGGGVQSDFTFGFELKIGNNQFTFTTYCHAAGRTNIGALNITLLEQYIG